MLAALILTVSPAAWAQSATPEPEPEPAPTTLTTEQQTELTTIETRLAELGGCTATRKAKREACEAEKTTLTTRKAELMAITTSEPPVDTETNLELDVSDE